MDLYLLYATFPSERGSRGYLGYGFADGERGCGLWVRYLSAVALLCGVLL